MLMAVKEMGHALLRFITAIKPFPLDSPVSLLLASFNLSIEPNMSNVSQRSFSVMFLSIFVTVICRPSLLAVESSGQIITIYDYVGLNAKYY